MSAYNQVNIRYLVVVMMRPPAFQGRVPTWRSVGPILYSQFPDLLNQKQVSDLAVTAETVSGKLTKALQKAAYWIDWSAYAWRYDHA